MYIRSFGHHLIYNNAPDTLPMPLASASEVITPHLGWSAGIVCCDASCRTYRHLSQHQPTPHHMHKPIAVVNSPRVLNAVLRRYVYM